MQVCLLASLCIIDGIYLTSRIIMNTCRPGTTAPGVPFQTSTSTVDNIASAVAGFFRHGDV